MEYLQLQKSPEESLEETLVTLGGNFKELSECTNKFSASIKGIYENDTITTHEKFNTEILKLQEESKPELREYHNQTISECDALVSKVQHIFEHYKAPYEEWCAYESRLQRDTEDHKNNIDKMAQKHENLLNHMKKRVDLMNKKFKEIKDLTIAEQEEKRLRNSQRACQRYSLPCIVFFVPRQIARFCGYISTKMRCTGRRPKRTTSHETLVIEKEKESMMECSLKDVKLIEDSVDTKTKTIIGALENVIGALKNVSNDVMYIHEDLCRLDYLQADREKHYEKMAGNYEMIMKNCRLYISSLVQLRADIAESLKLNGNLEEEDS